MRCSATLPVPSSCATSTLEDAYLALALGQAEGACPALFAEHFVYVILRGILDGCRDGLRLRAAECLFRANNVTIRRVRSFWLMWDTVSLHAKTGGLGSLGRLLIEAQTPVPHGRILCAGRIQRRLPISRAATCSIRCWTLASPCPGLELAPAGALEAWVRHFLDRSPRHPAAAGGARPALALASRGSTPRPRAGRRLPRRRGAAKGVAGAASFAVPPRVQGPLARAHGRARQAGLHRDGADCTGSCG